MTKEDLEVLFDRIRALPPEKLEQFAEFVGWLEARKSDVYVLSAEERAAVRRGLDDVANGRFASEEEMAEIFGQTKVPAE